MSTETYEERQARFIADLTRGESDEFAALLKAVYMGLDTAPEEHWYTWVAAENLTRHLASVLEAEGFQTMPETEP